MSKVDSKKKRISTGVKVGLIAIAINIITVAVYIYQTRLMQRQQHAAVWPYLEWRSIYNQNEGFILKVSNNGVGPALIKNAEINLHGEPILALDSLFKQLLGTDRFPHVRSEIINRVLPAGESINLVKVADPIWGEKLIYTMEKENFGMEICYESIYGDQWLCSGTQVVESKCN